MLDVIARRAGELANMTMAELRLWQANGENDNQRKQETKGFTRGDLVREILLVEFSTYFE